MRRIGSFVLTAVLACLCAASFAAPQELDWVDLIPEDERDRPAIPVDHSAALLRNDLLLDEAKPTYGVVESLDGEAVKIPGFIVPLGSGGPGDGLSEALLVPYMGACMHMPPPPPNQIVYIKFQEAVPIRDIWRPYWLEGRLFTQPFDSGIGDAGYTLVADSITLYNW